MAAFNDPNSVWVLRSTGAAQPGLALSSSDPPSRQLLPGAVVHKLSETGRMRHDLVPGHRPETGDAMPWILRRLPAVVSTCLTLAAGVALLAVSARFEDQWGWMSDLFLNLGVALVLFGPLFALSALAGRRFARSQTERDMRVERVAAEVHEVRGDVESILVQLSESAVGRLAQDRSADEATIASVMSHPTPANVAEALALGSRMGFVSTRGPRVVIFDTHLYARWEVPESDQSNVVVTVEARDGQPLRAIPWQPEWTAEDLAYAIGRALQETDNYPGDIAYDPGRMFADLHQLLELGYRATTGAGGLVDPIGPIIELTGERWVLTDFCITTREWPQYQITLDRLDELDWDTHLRGRRDIDIGGFRQAYDTAIALLDSRRLTPPRRQSPL
jgi:membrane protein implicated in regulation of membrane protease activity